MLRKPVQIHGTFCEEKSFKVCVQANKEKMGYFINTHAGFCPFEIFLLLIT